MKKIELAEKRMQQTITKHDMRVWELIQMHIQSLAVNSTIGRITVVCADGMQMDILYPQGGQNLTALSLIVSGPEAIALRKEWPNVRNPASGKFFNVPVEDVIELIWKHGGVNMPKSRKKTRELMTA